MYCYDCMNKTENERDYCFHCQKIIQTENYPHHLKPGTVLHDQYLVGNAIGEGGFGITYIGLDLSLNMRIAIKEFYPSGYANRNNTLSNNVTLNYSNKNDYFKNGKKQFLREAQNIAKFNNEHSIVDVRAFFEENDTAYIVMEYLEGVNLSTKIKQDGTYAPGEIFKQFIPIMRSLDKMHRYDIIHRDVSPDNIHVLPDGSFKLMDFGSARYFAGTEKKTMSVQYKPGYAPYEQYNKNGNQGPWTDVYGLCATIYKCITNITPVDSLERCQQDTLKKPSELGVKISSVLEQVLMYGMAIYPDNRCKSMNELIKITESALRNEKVKLRDSENNSTQNDINSTRSADDKYKTVFADSEYEAVRVQKNDSESLHQSPIDKGSADSKKNHSVMIVVLITLVLISAGGMIGFMLLNHSSSNEDSKSNSNETVTSQETTTEKEDESESVTESETSSKISIPDVSGKKFADASSELKALGLTIETEYEESSDVAEGYVIRQSVSEGRLLNSGDTVMLFVSSGKQTESTEQNTEESHSQNNEYKYYNVAEEVSIIRKRYYSTEDSPGTKSIYDGVTYYEKNGATTKIVCSKGTFGWNYTRSYYFHNNSLYFAFLKNGSTEHRLYFKDDTLIRYIDDDHITYDYGNIFCPYEEDTKKEAYELLD